MAYEKISPAAHAANGFFEAVKAGINPFQPPDKMPVRKSWQVLAGLGYVNLVIAAMQNALTGNVWLSAGEVMKAAGKKELPFTTAKNGMRFYAPPDDLYAAYDVGYQTVKGRDGDTFPALRAWRVFEAKSIGLTAKGATPFGLELEKIQVPAGVKVIEDEAATMPSYNPRKDTLRVNPANPVMRTFGLVLATGNMAKRKTSGEYAFYGVEYLTALLATSWLCAAAGRADVFDEWDTGKWASTIAKDSNGYKVAADGARKAIRLLTGIGQPAAK